MKTPRQRKLFKKLENHRKDRIHHLKGIGEIILPKIYCFKQKRNSTFLLYDGETIHSFPRDATIQDIKNFISNYKPLKDYCKAPASQCHQVKNCDMCHSLHKKWAEERRKKGDKLEKPKPEDILERGAIHHPINSQKIFFGRGHGIKWK